MTDDILLFADEGDASAEEPKEYWHVLIVDDDPEVHNVTRLVLSGFEFDDRRLSFHSVYSATEAKEYLQQHPDTALVFLDVVMEDTEAGLRLVHLIRKELNNQLIRIVLRTGQPGYAPESKVIMEYDINDYKEKTELTAQKLNTTVVAALRSYRDLLAIETNKKGLEQIVEASPEIFRLQSMQNFARGVLTQLAALLHLKQDALYVRALEGFAATRHKDGIFHVLAATGRFNPIQSYKDMEESLSPEILDRIRIALNKKGNLYEDHYLVLYWHGERYGAYLIYLEGYRKLSEIDRKLLDVFCLNVSAAFENLAMHQEMDATQREIFYLLMEVIETRSHETGNHVRRVGEYASLLGRKLHLPEKDLEMLQLASTMHDIGKLGVADSILNKPGKLTFAEFEVMKNHSAVGFEILHGSDLDMLKTAAIIALQHHERYDGTGYPGQLKGDEIHIFARITAIADVFDALGCTRSYKQAWPMEEIIAYMKQEKGLHFDPHLIDLLLDSMDEIREIQARLPD